MTVFEVPGMVFFAMTGEYTCKYRVANYHMSSGSVKFFR
jgi:hypothetical protein